MRNSKKLLLLTLVAMMTFSFAFATTASAKMVKKVDNFILLVDQSGSMAMKADNDMKKIEMVVKNIQTLNKTIPNLDYNAGMYLFAPNQEQCAIKPYNPANIQSAASAISTDYEIFNRRTPMVDGLTEIAGTLDGMSGKTALILFTDGESNLGPDPVAKAQAMRDTYGSNLCIHVVSYANAPAGEAVVAGIRKAFACSVPADAATFADAAALEQYAQDVFYDEVADAKPAPAPVPMAKETISFNLNFGFDKFEITEDMTPILNKATAILAQDPEATYVISGHTDSSGTEEYNQGLSERRANSVMNWLVANGIEASRIEAIGYGEAQPKYDNETKEGRRLNRRVEIQTN